ncbi:VTT domain-containing protein [uncultured Microscilla sp.]|uniref:TVP38/TMEM64 family protein n=1 Tax=uncultured Microscilla sp. TaxID=432653 RepID=UPI002634555C|nr:VTT domain-containing protein [uncultured Microscilla sp.]
MKIVKRIVFALWVGLLLFCLGYAIYHPQFFTAEGLQTFFQQFEQHILLVYVLLSIVRGLALFPSTPFVIAGSLLFPHQPLMVVVISMAGILFSAVLIYYFSQFMGFDAFFQRKFPHQILKVRKRLNHRYGFFYVLGWAFFPLVPTDIVCYVAGTIRMKILSFLAAIFLGELILVNLYVYGSSFLFSWLV